MEKKGWKQIAMGTVVSIAGVLGLTSCENKNENQDNSTWTAESWEEGVTITRPGFTYDFSTPEDSIREAKEKIKALKEFNKRAKRAKSDNNEWKIVQRDDQTEYSSTVENGSSEWTSAEPNLVIEYGGETYDFGEPKISQKPNEPEKKEPPSISKDAFINALLEQKRGRGGKKS